MSHPSCRRSIMGRTAYEPWSMRLVDDGSPRPTFWSFVLGHDSLSPVQQQRHWLEDTVCLELIRHKDGRLASSACKISEDCPSVHPWCYETCSYTTTVLNERMWLFGGQSILWPPPTYFQGVMTKPPGSTALERRKHCALAVVSAQCNYVTTFEMIIDIKLLS